MVPTERSAGASAECGVYGIVYGAAAAGRPAREMALPSAARSGDVLERPKLHVRVFIYTYPM